MLRRLFSTMTAALLSGGLLIPSLRATESNNTASTVVQPNGQGVQTEDLHPFRHFARIPAGADLSTIRFEKVRLVSVPSRIRYTADEGNCKELAFRDAGGSIGCTYTQAEAPVPAYEVTYSFTGQPMTSDEYADRHFTLSVFFGLDELAPDVQKALAGRKLSRSDASAFFAVSTYRENETRVAIDTKQSHSCEGNYVDGMWAHMDAGCKDTIGYTVVTAPSGYITVNVDAATSRVERAGMISAK